MLVSIIKNESRPYVLIQKNGHSVCIVVSGLFWELGGSLTFHFEYCWNFLSWGCIIFIIIFLKLVKKLLLVNNKEQTCNRRRAVSHFTPGKSWPECRAFHTTCRLCWYVGRMRMGRGLVDKRKSVTTFEWKY